MNALIGQPVSRVDGPVKVTGQASYAAEFRLRTLCYGAIVPSRIASGRISKLDASAAERAPGVLAVIWHENCERLPYHKLDPIPIVDPKSGQPLRVMQTPEILFDGQPIAVVIAETQVEAEAAAALVRVEYEARPARTVLQGAPSHPPAEPNAKSGRPGTTERGDADAALAAAAVRIDGRYSHAREHHNAMEPHATIAEWDGGRLTLYDKAQWVDNCRREIAHVFGMQEADIRVVAPFVGGAFGSALRTWPHVAIAAVAARRVGRPVRVELSRRQCFSSIGFRPHTDQRVSLGADRDGKLTAIVQEAVAQTSVYEEYAEATLSPPRNTYSCANVRTEYRFVDLNTNTPCPMRGPGEATGVQALEMAMDELAEALRMDPLTLRLRNYAERDEAKNLPWSSKALRECYAAAAARFGWERRPLEVRAMRDGRDWIGWGMATTIYPADRMPASAEAVLYSNGTVVVRSAASDMGPGTYTAMSQLAAATLGLPIERISFELGDSDMPAAPVHGGSITLVSVGNAVVATCTALRERVTELAGGDGAAPEDWSGLLQRHGLQELRASGHAKPEPAAAKYSSSGFGAVFVEVRVDAEFGTIRVPRIVGAYDVGVVVNPKLARSQCIGGMVGGLGMALLERAEWDSRIGRVMNANLAEYLVPVCADIRELDVTFVPSEDRIFSPIGAKGLAEIALCGVAPAIANAVWHATGRRVRDLPILPEALLD
ncbi:MAG TPA: xanthine dehydrogenase family protein molybdopterin-binding subunit [Acetobacteraceae bacterium]|nr:xanthine dehydrogenase family protein molybdopterin-binding subunit [Acetobacteraceae bacterium]